MRAHIYCAHPQISFDDVSRSSIKLRGNYGVHQCSVARQIPEPPKHNTGRWGPTSHRPLSRRYNNANRLFVLLLGTNRCSGYHSYSAVAGRPVFQLHTLIFRPLALICYGHARRGNNFAIAPRRQSSGLRAFPDYQYTQVRFYSIIEGNAFLDTAPSRIVHTSKLVRLLPTI